MSQPLRARILQDPDIFPLIAQDQNITGNPSDCITSIVEAIEPFEKNDLEIVAFLHRWKNRQLTRIGYLELIFSPSLESIAQQLTSVCESIVGAPFCRAPDSGELEEHSK